MFLECCVGRAALQLWRTASGAINTYLAELRDYFLTFGIFLNLTAAVICCGDHNCWVFMFFNLNCLLEPEG